MNPLFAQAILGTLTNPNAPTSIPLPDMRGAFGLSPQAFEMMYNAQAQRGMAEAQLQADAAQQAEQARQFDTQAQLARYKAVSDVSLGERGLGIDQHRADTGRMGVEESARSNKVGEKLSKKGFKETKRSNLVDEQNAAASVAQGAARIGLAQSQLEWDKIMDGRRIAVDETRGGAMAEYYNSMAEANRAKASGGSGLSVSEDIALNNAADKYARTQMGDAGVDVNSPEALVTYEQHVNNFLRYKGAPPLPGTLPVDVDFSDAMLKPGWKFGGK